MIKSLENFLDYTQDNPILDSQNPFGNNFDASIIWAPIMGRLVYTGGMVFVTTMDTNICKRVFG